MKVTEIFEARRNPHLNPRESFDDMLERLYRRYKDKLYVSFTERPKLGINTQYTFDTPLGIYGYPAYYVHEEGGKENLPFASERPYAYFFTANGRELHLGTYSKSDYRSDLKKLMKALYNTNPTQEQIEEIADNGDLNLLVKRSQVTDRRNKHSPGALIWAYLYAYSNYYTNGDERDSYTIKCLIEYVQEDVLNTGEPNHIIHKSKASTVFNILLRQVLKYDYVVDPGTGIQHSNEPTQAVFLDKSAVKVVGMIDLGLIHEPDEDSILLRNIETLQHNILEWIWKKLGVGPNVKINGKPLKELLHITFTEPNNINGLFGYPTVLQAYFWTAEYAVRYYFANEVFNESYLYNMPREEYQIFLEHMVDVFEKYDVQSARDEVEDEDSDDFKLLNVFVQIMRNKKQICDDMANDLARLDKA